MGPKNYLDINNFTLIGEGRKGCRTTHANRNARRAVATARLPVEI